MKIVLTILAAGILTDNLLFSKLIGIGQADKSFSSLLKRCVAVSAISFLSCLALYPFSAFVLEPFGLDAFSTLAAAVFVGVVFGSAGLISGFFMKPVFKFLKEEFYSLLVSSLLVVISLVNIENSLVTGYFTAALYFAASLVGFTVATIILNMISSYFDTDALPKAVRGLPLILIIAALFSMALGSLA